MRLAFFAASLLLPVAALAADWRAISGIAGWEYDASTLRRSSGGVTVWFKYRMIPAALAVVRKGYPDKDFSGYDFSLVRYELRCAARTTKLLTATEYDAQGVPIVSQSTSVSNIEANEVLPDSVMERALTDVCARASRSK
jgi:hypothetical protein